MALQITTGAGSLVAVGMSLGDVSTLYALGRRFGNWVTAQSGDTDFLELLQTDELDILRRRGMIDVFRFNKRWAQRARLLMNGHPTELVGDDATNVLGTLSRFTATMVAVVAALDGFMSYPVLKNVIKRLMKELLRTTEFGEDVISSQLGDRVNAWRSAAYVRSLSVRVQRIRLDLISSRHVLDGYMPDGEAPHMVEFLFWLLAGNTQVFTTSSSDVAGVAMVLSEVAFDMLSVGPRDSPGRDTGCRLVYDPTMLGTTRIASGMPTGVEGPSELSRLQSTTVPLQQPEEAFSSLPIKASVSNAARQAWVEGSQAAKFVQLRLKAMNRLEPSGDLVYEVVDLGSPPGRIKKEIYALAKDRGLCMNAELCHSLTVTLERMDDATLAWLHQQKGGQVMAGDNIASHSMKNQERVDAFTVYQAFVLGYYYDIFLRLVDTSGLAIAVVDGRWGYRSEETLDLIREYAVLKPLTRENLQIILAALLFSFEVEKSAMHGPQRCIGIIGKRALLVNSLITKSDTIDAVGKFTLLDVDVGGIPCNSFGLVRPGEAEFPDSDLFDPVSRAPKSIIPKVPDQDFTKHIEPDWDTDPETILLVMRYRGRRILTINPAIGDQQVCISFVEPVDKPAEDQVIPLGIEYTIQDFLSGKMLYTKDEKAKVVVQSKGMPGIRYAAVASYQPYRLRGKKLLDSTQYKSHLALVSNCVVAAASRIAYIIVT